MLVSMTVRNIALIEQLNIQFHQGLHVLTGETGAGKSIVVDSLNLMLGERADRGLIRSGAEKASVEALVDISACPQVQALLAEQSLEPEGGLMSIHREITLSDRNLCRVCGVIVPLAFLRQISALLVDIHGQHEHQSLLDVKNHMDFLDSFGDEGFAAQQKRVAESYHVWKESSAKFGALRKENTQREQKTELVSAKLKELEAARIQVGEVEKLSQERAKMAGAEKINASVEVAYHAVFLGDGAQQSAMLKLKNAADAMQSIGGFDARYQSLAERLSSAYYDVEDMGIELRDALSDLSFDPVRSEALQERLDLLRSLERRYGMPADDLAAYCEELKTEFALLGSMEDRLKRAEAEYKARLAEYRRQATALTEMRKALAQRFEESIELHLRDLGMASTRFACVFEAPAPGGKPVMPTEHGDDRLEFFIAPNPGEPLKPLFKTASGGELSRIMLALKAAGAGRNKVPCMIFDEIDTGISGHIAGVVAEKMAQIAGYCQVICVTHLAQIAAMAETQYVVEKHVSSGRTTTSVNELSGERRVEEIARLVGSSQQHIDSGLQHARNMLRSAGEYRQRHARP